MYGSVLVNIINPAKALKVPSILEIARIVMDQDEAVTKNTLNVLSM
jgi:hypothetical protein